MKRILIAVLACALFSPALSSAATFKGTDRAGGTVKFRTVKRHGRIVKVKRFFFDGVPMDCDEPPPSGTNSWTVTNKPYALPPMRVNRSRRFNDTFRNADDSQHTHVKGRFRRSLRKAGGLLELDGDFVGAAAPPEAPLGLHNCHTGDTHFRVHRI